LVVERLTSTRIAVRSAWFTHTVVGEAPTGSRLIATAWSRERGRSEGSRSWPGRTRNFGRTDLSWVRTKSPSSWTATETQRARRAESDNRARSAGRSARAVSPARPCRCV